MDAAAAKIDEILGLNSTFVVPPYQRHYAWEVEHWQKFWSTVLRALKDHQTKAESEPKFLGPVIFTVEETKYGNLYNIVDGQQRLTTIYILLVALRDIAKERGLPAAPHIEKRLYTMSDDGREDVRLTLKTDPSEHGSDRDSLKAVLDHKLVKRSKIGACYRFFRKAILGQIHTHVTEACQAQELDDIFGAVLSRCQFSRHLLGKNDNALEIFTSINSDGKPLSVADLFRLSLFQDIPIEAQSKVYHDDWKPIESRVSGDNYPGLPKPKGGEVADGLTYFIWNYMISEVGQHVKKDELYSTGRECIRKLGLPGMLADMAEASKVYSRVLDPAKETDVEIRRELQALQGIALGYTAHPMLLGVFKHHRQGKVTRAQLVDILRLLTSFFVRRWVCMWDTNWYSYQLPQVLSRALDSRSDDLLKGVQVVFPKGSDDSGTTSIPSDTEFRRALTTRDFPSNRREFRVLLDGIEDTFEHRERPSVNYFTTPGSGRCTDEHIMPKVLESGWARYLGENAETTHLEYHAKLGNRTLTTHNEEMGRKSFQEKREFYKDSNFSLSQYPARCDYWGPDEITENTKDMAERAIRKWPGTDHIAVEKPSEPSLKGSASNPTVNMVAQLRWGADTCVDVESWPDFILKTLGLLYKDGCLGSVIDVDKISKHPQDRHVMEDPCQLEGTPFFYDRRWLSNLDRRDKAMAVFSELTAKYPTGFCRPFTKSELRDEEYEGRRTLDELCA